MSESGAGQGRNGKAPTGIVGFDEISRGGVPSNRTTLVVGTPGAGKTVFALQTLVNGATEYGEAGVFVAFEENSQQIISNGGAFGWDLPGLQQSKLFFLDAYLSPRVIQSGGFDLAGMLAGLEERVRDMNAQRIVFDGLDVMLNLLDDPVAERREIYRIHEWLTELGLTGIITAKSSFKDPFSTAPWNFLQFMADCVVVLHHRVVDRVALRGARIVKYRGSAFSANEFPLVIGPSGIEIATFGPDELEYDVSSERVSTGVRGLDDMLGGGYYRGSSILVTGAPGTAKTTLGATFVDATCRAGERALYVSFDEPARQIVRNMRSIGVDLEPWVKEDMVRMYSVRTEVRSAEEHLVVLDRMIREFDPATLIVDPVSALMKSGGHLAAGDTSIRLLDLARARGITVLCTSLVSASTGLETGTEMHISTIADTWLHLAYAVQGGERNRSLSIVKSRGMAHSNQVREFVLSDHGASLSDVYVEGGEVLMGTARAEREIEARAEEQKVARTIERRRAEVEAQLANLRTQLEASESELQELEHEEQSQMDRRSTMRQRIRTLRGGEGDS
jgi:circadian clock protein KaiC